MTKKNENHEGKHTMNKIHFINDVFIVSNESVCTNYKEFWKLP